MVGSHIAYITTIWFLRKIFEPVELSLTYNVHAVLLNASKAVVTGKAQVKSLGLNKKSSW